MQLEERAVTSRVTNLLYSNLILHPGQPNPWCEMDSVGGKVGGGGRLPYHIVECTADHK